MRDRDEKAAAFRALHVKGDPLVLWNVWDAGSARAVAEAGAPAVATGSWSVAASQGYGDGQQMPLDAVLWTARQIAAAVDVPVSVDFEACYASGPKAAGENVARLLETGIVGINYEDREIGGEGLVDARAQGRRIAAVRKAAEAAGVALFINARTDVFFQGSDAEPADLMAETLARAEIYAGAGADGLFVPGLSEPGLIARVCEGTELPVNVMRANGGAATMLLADAGVARISHGPAPWRAAMAAVTAAAKALV